MQIEMYRRDVMREMFLSRRGMSNSADHGHRGDAFVDHSRIIAARLAAIIKILLTHLPYIIFLSFSLSHTHTQTFPIYVQYSMIYQTRTSYKCQPSGVLESRARNLEQQHCAEC